MPDNPELYLWHVCLESQTEEKEAEGWEVLGISRPPSALGIGIRMQEQCIMRRRKGGDPLDPG